MPYPAILVVHLLAVAVFLAGLLLAAGSLPALARAAPLPPAERDELRRLRAMNRYATTPALALVWACGIAMAIEGGWYRAGWLQAKALLVLGLSVAHAVQTRRLARLAGDRAVSPGGAGGLVAIVAAAAAIVTLVVAKP